MLDFNLCVNTLNGDRELKENGELGTRAYLGGSGLRICVAGVVCLSLVLYLFIYLCKPRHICFEPKINAD